ncbi:questin oxidase family protein [Microbulbifer guangxiensis]|uniref:questin oxidase family protein n=1 Tax=Microbulbifer guangxiensis TaxID=2904249 RepID=UPI001F342B75|nr:questin oxidase family protein [Microbulbifer guangxiensis]
MSISRYCVELLEAASAYHVRYGDRLANHLPMVLIALDKMGATREQLQSAFDRSSAHLERPQLEPAAPLAEGETIADLRNREERFPSALAYYQGQLRQHGIAEALRRELPPLLPSIGTAAFHGLIRTAYGIDAGHQQEVATGLAYWNMEYRELPASDVLLPVAAAEIPAMAAARFPLISLAPGNISDHMAAVTRQEDWQETPIQPQQLGLQDIAEVALAAYRGTGDFTLLHGVTGCHALRLILPHCSDPEQALRYFWRALVIAYLSTGPKEFTEADQDSPTAAEWESLLKRACRSEDDHVIKLCYSAWREAEHYGNDDYRAAAALTVES